MHHFLELRDHLLDEVALDILGIQVLLEFSIRKLVSIFEFTIVRTPILDGVVGQVDQTVLDVAHIVLATTGSQVSVCVEISLHISIHTSRNSECANVEFSALVEQRPFAILLNDEGAFLATNHVVLNDLLDLRQVTADGNTATPICILAWLHDPEIFAHGWMLSDGLALFICTKLFLKLCEGNVL